MTATATNALFEARHARLSADRTLGTRLRDASREPTPSPTNPPPSKPWLSVYGKRTLRTFGVFVPLAVVVFGWPFAAKYTVNLSNQVYDSTSQVVHEPAKGHKIARRAMLQERPVKLEA